MSEEERNAQEEQKRIQNEQAADSTKRVLSTAAKGAATAAAGPGAAAAIDAVEKIPGVDAAERSIAKGVNDVAEKINPNAKKNLAENNDKITTATDIADNAMSLGSSSTNFGQGTPENINLDNRGYNPNLDKMQATPNEVQNTSLNPNSINQDITPREESNEDLKELSKRHSKTNNINDEAKGKIKIPTVVIILLPIVAVIFLIIVIFLPLFYGKLNDEENYAYEYVNYGSTETCGRVIFEEDRVNLKEQIEDYDKKIKKAFDNSDTETANQLKKEKYNLIPSITVDEYVAGVVQKEVGGFDNEEIFYDFAIAARTYLFNNSSFEDNFCFIEKGTNTQDYEVASNEKIKEIVNKTHDYVLVDEDDNYVNTQYDAFCLDHYDTGFYYIRQNNQGLSKSWVDKNVDSKFTSDVCVEGHGEGMSQYGAYYLATVQKYGWKDILGYYYGDNIDIKKVNIIGMEKDGTILNAAVGEVNGNLPVSALGFAWPVTNITRCSSPFGWRSLGGGTNHRGIDIPQALGTPVYAASDGRVVHAYDSELCSNIGSYGHSCPGAGGYGSLGNHVIIETADGVQTIYGHMKQGSITVSFGQQVAQGTKVGEVASSGSSTGYHLHFGVRINNVYQDPFNYLANLPTSCGG